MVNRIQDGKLFYHATALENLENIFLHGLLSREDALTKGLLKIDVADTEIIEKRKELDILQYVPFHFFEKTPFTGAVYNAYKNITFVAITIKRDFAKKENFRICTAHPLSNNPKAEVLDYATGFTKINWEKVEERNYKDDVSKNACMAECLAPSPVPMSLINSIFVPNEEIKKKVHEIAIKILGNCPFHINIGEFCTQVGSNI